MSGDAGESGPMRGSYQSRSLLVSDLDGFGQSLKAVRVLRGNDNPRAPSVWGVIYLRCKTFELRRLPCSGGICGLRELDRIG